MVQTTNNKPTAPKGDYAGPPKSHSFTGNVPPSPANPIPSPANPIPSMPVHTSQHFTENDLLEKQSLIDQIMESEPKPEPEKKPLFDFDFHFDKKIFLHWDKKLIAYLNKYPLLKRTLQIAWGLVLTGIYLGGIAFFAAFLTIYFAFTPILRSYLDSKGLQNVSFTVVSHDLSQITLNNIADKNGTFKIKNIRLQYSFADLLKRRITLVDVDGLEIKIEDNKEAGFNVKEVASLFWKLGILDRNPPFKIQSLQMKNAKLFIGNNEYQLPINFTGIGELATTQHFLIPFTIQNQYLQAEASLDTQVGARETTWVVKIEKGRLTLPEQPALTINATATLKTQNLNVKSLTLNTAVLTEGKERTFTLSVLPAEAGKLNIEATADIPLLDSPKPFQANLTLKNVDLAKDFRSFKTNAPINLKLSNIQNKLLTAEIIQTTLNGDLSCSVKKCTFKLSKPSDLILFSPIKEFGDTKIDILYPMRLTLSPDKENLFDLTAQNVTFSSLLKNTTLNLRKTPKNQESSDLRLVLGNTVIRGNYNFNDKKGTLSIDGENVSYLDDALKFERATVQVQSTAIGTSLNIQSPLLSLEKVTLLKQPVSIDFYMDTEQYFKLQADTLNKQLSINANGYYNPYSGEILAAISTNSIPFKKGLLSLSEISGLFDESLANLTGNVTFMGQIHYKNERNVSGPLKMMLENVSFDYGNAHVTNLNTVITMSSLIPFGTQGVQTAFAEAVEAVLPMRDIQAQFYFDSSRRQFNISQLDVTMAGRFMRIDPTWLIYQAPIFTFTFKAKPTPVEDLLSNVKIKNLKATGFGTLEYTLQLEGDHFSLKSLQLDIPGEGMIAYTPAVYPNKNLEVLKNLPFRKATLMLNELADGTTDFLLIAENKNVQNRRRTTIRFNIASPLSSFVTVPKTSYHVPLEFRQMKESF